MRNFRFRLTTLPAILILTLLVAASFVYGCKSQGDSRSGSTGPQAVVIPAGPRAHPDDIQPAATVIDARPAALVDGKPVTWGELRPTLNELAGAEALQELVLDRKLNAALEEAGIMISTDDAVGERRMLLESLSDDANAAVRLLDELRLNQRLGPARFEALLLRNAGLRALVRDQVEVTHQAVETAFEIAHGPKRQARLMVLRDLQTAESAIYRVKGGEPFADVAVELSDDASAARGGLLEPLGRADPAYPEALRQALFALAEGETSGPVLLDGRYAVIMLVKRIDGDGAKLEDVRPELERIVRRNQERLLMDRLTRQLIGDTQVTIFDDSLQDSWTRRRRSPR